MAPKFALLLGGGIAIFVASIGITSAILNLYDGWVGTSAASKATPSCQIIATDPNPPLNVRSSPVVASDNVVGTLKNGTLLTVVDQNEGWLRISSPIEGWVYERLTAKTCVRPPTGGGESVDRETQILAQATELYHSGNLNAAVALAGTIPSESAMYPTARRIVSQWQQDWKTAENEFYSAQKALRDSRWQDVLRKVNTFPDNRYWKEKLTPIVQEALKRQSNAGR